MIKLEAAELAARIKTEVKAEIDSGLSACLAAVRVGDDPASAVYVRNKIKACEEVGIRSEHHALPESTTETELLELVNSLNARDDVDGILVQLPLPRAINETAIIEAIDPAKDVDGFHPINAGKLAMGRPVLKTAVAVNPKFFQARYILARCYLALDRYDDAFKTYDEAVNLASDADRKQLAGTFGFMGVGDGFMKTNRAKDAVRAYERGLQIDPANSELQTKLAAARAKLTP